MTHGGEELSVESLVRNGAQVIGRKNQSPGEQRVCKDGQQKRERKRSEGDGWRKQHGCARPTAPCVAQLSARIPIRPVQQPDSTTLPRSAQQAAARRSPTRRRTGVATAIHRSHQWAHV